MGTESYRRPDVKIKQTTIKPLNICRRIGSGAGSMPFISTYPILPLATLAPAAFGREYRVVSRAHPCRTARCQSY